MSSSVTLPRLTPLVSHRELDAAEIQAAAAALLDSADSEEAKADFLRAWARRGETAPELAACAEAFLPQALDPGVRGSWKNRPLLDCCGTGGGGLNLINISTGVMFVLAALDVPVVKHGNRGLTKKSGSADVLEALGIRIDLPPEKTSQCLEEVGCAFLFAPAYHLSFAGIAPVRRRLAAEGQRTVFNLLGPLLNPARPDARLVGVFKREHVALFAEALRLMKCPRYSVACGIAAHTSQPLGEVSADFMTVSRGTRYGDEGEKNLGSWRSRYGALPSPKIETLLVADAAESANRLTALLKEEKAEESQLNWDRRLALETLITNAAVALQTQSGDGDLSLPEAHQKCRTAIDSGEAFKCLERWRRFSRSC